MLWATAASASGSWWLMTGRRIPLVSRAARSRGPLTVVLDEHAVEGDIGVQQRVQVEFGSGDGRGLAPGAEGADSAGQRPPANQVGDGIDLARRQA